MATQTRKARREAVPASVFDSTYIRLAKAGKTVQEIADELKMDVQSVTSRGSALRSRLLKESDGKVKIPYPANSRNRSSGLSVADAEALLAELDGSGNEGEGEGGGEGENAE